MGSRIAQRTQELVALAKQGNTSALAQLCSAYGERLRRIVRLRMGPELRSQLESVDVVQDALIGAVEDLGDFTYRDEGDFLRWLSKIAENRIRESIDRLHAGKRDIRRQVSLERLAGRSRGADPPGIAPLVTTTPSMVLSRREELDRLEKAMDRIKPEYREVIMLAKIERLPHRDIAIRLNRSPGAVAMLLSRAILALGDAFERV